MSESLMPIGENAAKWWELWLATLFGRKRTFDCGSDGTIKVSYWRGKTYLLYYTPAPSNFEEKTP